MEEWTSHSLWRPVISLLHDDIVSKAAETPGFAIGVCKDAKLHQYVDGCHASGIDFVPLVMESLGGWDKEAASHLKHMALCTARQIGAEQSKILIFSNVCQSCFSAVMPPFSWAATHHRLPHIWLASCDSINII
jgi:hypothetical protein